MLGTRPEIIKFYPIIKYCQDHKLDHFVIHTNQHYDTSMDKAFFEELNISYPNYNLNVRSGSHAVMSAKMILGIEQILETEKPTHLLVQGDTNSTMAGALVATKMHIKVAHIEGGLRSYDRDMPEEINRIIVDHIADYIFPPTQAQKNILLGEGISDQKIIVSGNTIVDAIYLCKDQKPSFETIVDQLNLKNQKFVLLTCHRPSNTDNLECFQNILEGINEICKAEDLICIFPAHPRLDQQTNLIAQYSQIKVIKPTSFLNSILLQNYSEMIFTDSGGIQEESCILEKKTIILRTNTERPESVEVGGAILLDEITADDIKAKFEILKNRTVTWYNPFGNGKSAQIIMEAMR